VPGSAQYGVKALFFDVFGTLKRRSIGLPSGIVGNRHQYGDAPHPFALLRARRERPRRRAAEQRDELAAVRLITSSAHANTTGASRSGLPIRIVARRRNSDSPVQWPPHGL